jgi:hypothetical protein
MQRIIGLETEYAVGFEPGGHGSIPSQETLFGALLRSLKSRHLSCEALYYKGGDFFSNGSLIHFEVSRLEDPESGLLEWATPECLGPLEAAHYAKAQEHALAQAIADAEAELAANGYEGRVFLLKNNEDRFGNQYGCHESYDVVDHPRGWLAHVATWLLHPLILTAILVLGVALTIPVLTLVLSLLAMALLTQLIGLVPGLRGVSQTLRDGVQRVGEYLIEVSPTPGSGVAAHTALWFLRIGGRLFSLTARWVLFTRHLPAFWAFLVTRPVFAGAGHLAPDGQYRLTARSRAVRRTIAAFIFGPSRPLVDVKEFFYRRPFSYRSRRKRLHHLAGDANRSEYAELLKLSTTAAVLDAIEGGSLDDLARNLKLIGGPLAAFRATSDDPQLQTAVARDRASGELLTAVQVQRRYLEAVWEHHRKQASVDPETKDALVRWNFVLEQLEQNPRLLDGELDWVIKRVLGRRRARGGGAAPARGSGSAVPQGRAPRQSVRPQLGAVPQRARDLAAAEDRRPEVSRDLQRGRLLRLVVLGQADLACARPRACGPLLRSPA